MSGFGEEPSQFSPNGLLTKLCELQGIETHNGQSAEELESLGSRIASAVNSFGGGSKMYLDAVFVGMGYCKLTERNREHFATSPFGLN